MSFDLYHWLAGIITHAVTNMILDYLILCLPIIFRRHLEIESRGRSALIALFTFGGWYVARTISTIELLLILEQCCNYLSSSTHPHHRIQRWFASF